MDTLWDPPSTPSQQQPSDNVMPGSKNKTMRRGGGGFNIIYFEKLINIWGDDDVERVVWIESLNILRGSLCLESDVIMMGSSRGRIASKFYPS